MGSARICCSTLLALILPPVAVFVARGCDCQLLINILLTLCGYIPGIIHALFVICITDDDRDKGLPVTSPTAAPVAVVAGAGAPGAAVPQPMPAYPQGVHPVPVTGHPVAPPPGQQYYPPVPQAVQYVPPSTGYPSQQKLT